MLPHVAPEYAGRKMNPIRKRPLPKVAARVAGRLLLAL